MKRMIQIVALIASVANGHSTDPRILLLPCAVSECGISRFALLHAPRRPIIRVEPFSSGASLSLQPGQSYSQCETMGSQRAGENLGEASRRVRAIHGLDDNPKGHHGFRRIASSHRA